MLRRYNVTRRGPEARSCGAVRRNPSRYQIEVRSRWYIAGSMTLEPDPKRLPEVSAGIGQRCRPLTMMLGLEQISNFAPSGLEGHVVEHFDRHQELRLSLQTAQSP